MGEDCRGICILNRTLAKTSGYGHRLLSYNLRHRILGISEMAHQLCATRRYGIFYDLRSTPHGASLERTDKVVAQVAGIIGEMPEVQDVIEMSGFSFLAGGAGSNLGSMFVMLKPWNQRKGKDHSVEAVMQRVNEKCAAIQEAVTFAINPPAIPGLGLSAGLQMQLLDINSHGAKENDAGVA